MKTTKPIVYLDIEATGLEASTDRIITLAVVRDEPECRNFHAWKFNPGIPIPPEATAVHGITDQEVKDFPVFGQEAKAVHAFLAECDLAGYNLSNFDLPMLWEEFHRCGIDWDLNGALVIDVCTIFKRKEERTLEAAVKFYTGRGHDGAHNSMEDALATKAVFEAQLKRYPDLGEMTLEEVAAFSGHGECVDLAGRIRRDKDGDPCYNVGKYRFNSHTRTGMKIKDDPGLAYWMMDKDFPTQTKLVLGKILEEIHKEQEKQQASLF